jgi:hypothetical protein
MTPLRVDETQPVVDHQLIGTVLRDESFTGATTHELLSIVSELIGTRFLVSQRIICLSDIRENWLRGSQACSVRYHHE